MVKGWVGKAYLEEYPKYSLLLVVGKEGTREYWRSADFPPVPVKVFMDEEVEKIKSLLVDIPSIETNDRVLMQVLQILEGRE